MLQKITKVFQKLEKCSNFRLIRNVLRNLRVSRHVPIWSVPVKVGCFYVTVGFETQPDRLLFAIRTILFSADCVSPLRKIPGGFARLSPKAHKWRYVSHVQIPDEQTSHHNRQHG